MHDGIIRQKSFQFALESITLYREMIARQEFVLSKQLLRSSTSIGANVEEAISAASRRGFLAKMTIALKEARETCYWLRLLDESQLVQLDVKSNLSKANELVRILAAIVKTTGQSIQ